MDLLLRGNRFSLFIEGELKKFSRKEFTSIDNPLDYFLYWYEGIVEVKTNFGKPLGKFVFKTAQFKDYWAEGILSLKDCFIFFEQKTLFYNRFYEGADLIGVQEGKFCFLVDFVAEDLLNQIENKQFPLCPPQFKLLYLVERGICYKNKYSLESSENY